jgi:hypothetical protein
MQAQATNQKNQYNQLDRCTDGSEGCQDEDKAHLNVRYIAQELSAKSQSKTEC